MGYVLRVLTVILLTALVCGCGVKTAYNNADWLLMRWINERVSLDDEQERAVRASLEANLDWHCTNELPGYAAFLRQVDEDVETGRVDARTVEAYGEEVSRFGQRLLVQLRPLLIDLLVSLDDAQVADLMESFDERNRELLEEAETYSNEDAIRDRAEGMEKGLRRFTGRLTDEQSERLHSWAANLDPTAEMILEQRLEWQAAFARALRFRKDRARFEAEITELMQPGVFTTEAYQLRREQNRDRTIRTIADIHAMATEDQIEKLRGKLLDFSKDLEQLSCS